MVSMEMMRSYLNHITAGEFEAAMGYWADDIVIHVSGNNPTSGTYTGKEAAAGWAAQSVGAVDSVQIDEHDLLVGDEHAVLLNTSHSERNGKHQTSNGVVVYHTEGDKITEAWIINEDQKAVDEFLT